MISVSNPAAPREFLSAQDCRALHGRLLALGMGGGDVRLSIESQWIGGTKWARNRSAVSRDVQLNPWKLTRTIVGAQSWVSATRLDDDGLREVLRDAERVLRYLPENPEFEPEQYVDQPILQPVIWSDATYGFDAGVRTKTVQAMIEPAEAGGLISAGELATTAEGSAVFDTTGLARYYPSTEMRCSVTVRDLKQNGSGWAGVSHFDIKAVDPAAIAARALDKCRRSANPVAVEPGRYVAILEPQATADLFSPIMELLDREYAEAGRGPFTNGAGLSKIGEQVLDTRLTLRSDPMVPGAGFLPFDLRSGEAYRPVDWISKGILRELAYGRSYARTSLHQPLGLPAPRSYILTPEPGVTRSTIDTMIANTERGVLVTRLSGVQMLEDRSVTCAGFTRDGLWLVERGKISKAIRNFRFRYSPLYALNSLDQVGAPERVFSPGLAILAPAVRVRDFNFTEMSDAI